MAKETLEEYDLQRIQEVEKTLTKMYEYYYGVRRWRPHVKRLETILKKIKELKELKTKY